MTETVTLPVLPLIDDVPKAVLEHLDVRRVSDVADIVHEALEPAQEASLAA